MRIRLLAVLAGTCLGHAQAQAAQEPCGPPVRLSSGVIAGQLIHKVMPVYPQEARDAHVSGAVVVHAIVGCDGHITEESVVSGPQMLRQAYLDAIRQWVYRPYLLNGKPVPVDTTITINFSSGG